MVVTVQLLTDAGFATLANPGVESRQLLWRGNAPDAAATITHVTMQPGAVSQRHHHPLSEQTWIIQRGTATLLLAAGETRTIAAGDVVRTPVGAVHGVENTGEGPFVYLAVTVPPQDFSAAYGERR